MTTIGFIGSGHIGGAVAQSAVTNGYDVVLSNSRGPETLAPLVAQLGEHARAGTSTDAAEAGDFVVVSIPFKAVADVPVAPLAGKVVLDTNNYYAQRDGVIPTQEDGSTTVSETLQQHLPTSKVVKAFNHIRFDQIISTATPSGTPGRRALAIAGDDAEAKGLVTAFLDDLGFDVVDLGVLAEGWRIQAGTPGYGPELTAAELEAAAERAER